jgi:SAM-dependent methyltransferase
MASENEIVGGWRFDLELPVPDTRSDAMFPPSAYRRPWNHGELVSIFPATGIRALDLGAGRNPLVLRGQDELVTLDFEPEAGAEVTVDLATSWPFGEGEFDLVYMSHVLEHLYPQDRDTVIRSVYRSMRPEALLFIRVPHRSSFNSTGWEHHTSYGLAELVSLCHGHNPTLPMFRTIAVGVSMSVDFYVERSAARKALERGLSRYWRLTDMVLSHLVGGIPEVQFMLQRMSAETEGRLREAPLAYLG